MSADAMRHWTDELAHDPRSTVFLQLAEYLRRESHLDEARRVALRGLERHPYLADAHDVLARILADVGDEVQARDEWEMALRLEPSHAGALKGLGFLAWRRRDLRTAERLLALGIRHSPGDDGLVEAYHKVRTELHSEGTPRGQGTPSPDRTSVRVQPSPGTDPFVPSTSSDARTLFASLLGDGDRTALLLDGDGLVMAGTYVDGGGVEVAEEVGAHLSGLAVEAARALEQLQLGSWESLMVEAQHATVALAPAPDGAVVLVAAARDTQVGFVRRLLARAAARAAAWLEVPA